jgi:hypothetical protein
LTWVRIPHAPPNKKENEMSDQLPVESIVTTLNVTDKAMMTHLITFLIQTISAIEHLENKKKVIEVLLTNWEDKFKSTINIVKKATAQTYAENQKEDEDVWGIIVDASNTHIDDLIKNFKERMEKAIFKSMNIVT